MAEKYNLKSEDIASGSPGAISPIEVHSSPNGDLVTFLFPDGTGKRQLFSINLQNFDWHHHDASSFVSALIDTSNIKETLSLEEQLRRERMRLFVQGISTYEWCHTVGVQTMLIPLSGGVNILKIQDVQDPSTFQFLSAYDGQTGAAIDPHLAPNGTAVAFILKNDIYVRWLNNAPSNHRVTFEGEKEGFSAGIADFVAQEEMNRYRGFWWSPNSKWIAFTRNDESKIPQYQILHQGKEDPKHAEYHRYPFAGKRNPIVRLGVLNLENYSPEANPADYTTLFDISDPIDSRFHTLQEDTGVIETEYYVCRVDWWQDGSIMAQIQNRNQDLLQLLRINPLTGERQVLLEETSPIWINIHDLWKPLSPDFRYNDASHTHNAGDFYFIWGSERSGFMQLYFYKYDSILQQAINLMSDGSPIGVGGEWVVESIDAIDETNHYIYYSGNYSDSRERHLVRASFLPANTVSSFRKISKTPGWHSSEVNTKHSFILDTFSSTVSCATFNIHSFDRTTGEILKSQVIYDSSRIDSRFVAKPTLLSSLVTPILHTVSTNHGTVDLECAVYLPEGVALNDYLGSSGHQKNPPFPAIVSVYGGPHVQRVANQWLLTSDLRAQKFAQNGIVVIKCDNRGSFRRGIAFEGAIKHDMGNIEVQDQVAAVNYFVNIGLIDPNHVGMFGWSYGGYMSAMSLCRAPDVFRCGVAGAPVTSWDGYDTHYTERYMGRPQENVIGYEDSNVMTHVAKMTGKLLLVHGLIDENVHFRHTARLINALIGARKRYELILFPCERHSPHKLQDRIYLEDIMWEFFQVNL